MSIPISFSTGCRSKHHTTNGLLRRLVRVANSFARRRVLACTSVAGAALLIRLLLLPINPIPHPRIHDEFSYLLGADTFASGSVTNRSHPLWHFFETFHVLSVPTYASKYPPGQALVLAFGQIVFGHPWFGVWLSVGIMAGVLCWMLQGWVPPGWALLTGLVAMFRLTFHGDWMNSYWGGAVAAIGGALVIGAYPRVVFKHRIGYVWAFWSGAIILINSRPFEGALLVLPSALALLRWMFGSSHSTRRVRLCLVLGSGALLLCGAGVAMGYQNWRTTGSPWRLPYLEYEHQYSASPLLIFGRERQPPVYRNDLMRRYYAEISSDFGFQRSLQGGLEKLSEFSHTLRYFLGPFLMLPLVFIFKALHRRRVRLPSICIVVGMVGLAVEPFHRPQYAAPFVGALFVLWAESARQFRLWSWRGRQVGLALICSLVTLSLLLGILQAVGPHRNFFGQHGPHPLDRRPAIEAELLRAGGSHIIFVRYAATHSVHEEWVYNRARIDQSSIVWARDLGVVENLRLLSYFSHRTAWILEPDVQPTRLRPYLLQGAGQRQLQIPRD